MNEKIYNTMKSVGKGNIIIGVIIVITGAAALASGIVSIVYGAVLLKKKSDILF